MTSTLTSLVDWQAVAAARWPGPEPSDATPDPVHARLPESQTTPLLWCAEVDGRLVAPLIAAGADPHAVDAQGRTVLMRVFTGPGWSHHRSQALDALLDQAVSLKAVDHQGQTLVDYLAADPQAAKSIQAARAGDTELKGFARLAAALGLSVAQVQAMRAAHETVPDEVEDAAAPKPAADKPS